MRLAEKALVDLRRAELKLRAVTLTAKEKVRVREGHPCDPLTCPLARGYYDRVKPMIREALEHKEITRSVLNSVGQKHQVCPFELSLDVSVWVDAVICDNNSVFDPQVYLRRHFSEDGGPYGFLVDEAHNLVDRERDMFSADLDGREILEVSCLYLSVSPSPKLMDRMSAARLRLAYDLAFRIRPTGSCHSIRDWGGPVAVISGGPVKRQAGSPTASVPLPSRWARAAHQFLVAGVWDSYARLLVRPWRGVNYFSPAPGQGRQETSHTCRLTPSIPAGSVRPG